MNVSVLLCEKSSLLLTCSLLSWNQPHSQRGKSPLSQLPTKAASTGESRPELGSTCSGADSLLSQHSAAAHSGMLTTLFVVIQTCSYMLLHNAAFFCAWLTWLTVSLSVSQWSGEKRTRWHSLRTGPAERRQHHMASLQFTISLISWRQMQSEWSVSLTHMFGPPTFESAKLKSHTVSTTTIIYTLKTIFFFHLTQKNVISL